MVGMTQFVNPSPNWKACTATCLVIPVKSAIGTMIGITAAAWPEPEEMKKLIKALARNMKPAPKTAPMWLIGFASQYTIVSRIMPLLMRTVRQFAKPTMKAAPTVLAQPLMKRLKPTFISLQLTHPIRRQTTRNVAEILSAPYLNFNAPITTAARPATIHSIDST